MVLCGARSWAQWSLWVFQLGILSDSKIPADSNSCFCIFPSHLRQQTSSAKCLVGYHRTCFFRDCKTIYKYLHSGPVASGDLGGEDRCIFSYFFVLIWSIWLAKSTSPLQMSTNTDASSKETQKLSMKKFHTLRFAYQLQFNTHTHKPHWLQRCVVSEGTLGELRVMRSNSSVKPKVLTSCIWDHTEVRTSAAAQSQWHGYSTSSLQFTHCSNENKTLAFKSMSHAGSMYMEHKCPLTAPADKDTYTNKNSVYFSSLT